MDCKKSIINDSKEIRDSLTAIPFHELMKVKQLFLQEWPKHLMAYSTIHSLCVNTHGHAVRVLAPAGDATHGVICLWSSSPTELCIFCPADDTSKLEYALLHTTHIPWSVGVSVPYMSVPVSVCLQRVLTTLRHAYFVRSGTIVYLPPHKAEKLHTTVRTKQDAVSLIPLDVSHTEDVSASWPHGSAGSHEYFYELLKAGAGTGVQVGGEGHPQAWGIVSWRGELHAIHTQPNSRRQGLASLLIANMAIRLQQQERPVWGGVLNENKPSFDMFMNLQFEVLCEAQWVLVNIKDNLL